MPPTPAKITPKQMEALRFIGRYIARFGRAPTVRELAEAVCGNRSTNPTAWLLKPLRKNGYLPRARRRHRLLTLTETGERWYQEDRARLAANEMVSA